MAYRFSIADTPELRRWPWEKMEAEGLTRAILWNRLQPTLLIPFHDAHGLGVRR